MCLSIPVKIEAIRGQFATASLGGTEYKVNISLVEDAGVGDYVLLHAGIAIQKIDEQYAQETLQLIEEMNSLEKK
jgi:hydrogenase expression/formation protein HypC